MENLEQIMELMHGLGMGAQQAFIVYLVFKLSVQVLWASVILVALLKMSSLITAGIARNRLLSSLNVILRDDSTYWSDVEPSYNIERIIKRSRDLVSLESKAKSRGLK